MSPYTRGNIKIAIAMLRANKGRSLLTMLGIIIGVVAVITVVGIGQGIKHQVSARINHVGQDLITVQPATAKASNSVLNALSPVRLSGGLAADDLHTVTTTPGVARAAALGVVPGTVKANGKTYTAGPVIATNPDLAVILNQNLQYGAFFAPNDVDSSVAVLGANVATTLFGQPAPLGQNFTFRGQTFVVNGIFNDFASAPLSSDADFNNTIFIPYSMAQLLTNNNASIYEILAKPTDSGKLASVRHDIDQRLYKLHGNSHDVVVLEQSQVADETNGVLNLLTELIAGAAAVSLLVGGIGIMNIMLVSVTERMHEVGIRKAVGATNRQILIAFLTEATVLSITGGIIGIVIAFIIDICLRIFTSLTPIVSWQVVLLAAGVSIAVGIIFGSVPALKAARKDPIVALRNE